VVATSADVLRRRRAIEEKLAKEKKLEDRAYLVAKYLVDPLLKDRTALLPDKPATIEPPVPESATIVPTNAPKIEVTTPPVSVPPAPPSDSVKP
jgi:hypothetical protein